MRCIWFYTFTHVLGRKKCIIVLTISLMEVTLYGLYKSLIQKKEKEKEIDNNKQILFLDTRKYFCW